jgi:ABC-2 type transport system permease protein
MRRFLILTKAMFLIHMRDRALLFWNLAFPIFLLIIYGAVFGGDDVTEFMAWTMPGVVAINLLAFGLLSSSTMMTDMRSKGVLRRLQASPTPAGVLLGAYVLVNVLLGLVQSALIIVVAVAFYGVSMPPQNLLLAVPGIVIALLTAVALGQVVGNAVRSASAAIAIGQVLYFGQMFITDLIMPIRFMPDWIQQVGPWLPGYAIAQLVRPPLQDGALSPELGANLLLAVVYSVAAALVAARLFKWEAKA